MKNRELLALPLQIRKIHRAQTRDSMQTYDSQTIDSAGAFLIGELERLDQTLHMPLVSISWSRDIDLREDVSIADEVSSFTNSSFASAGGASPAGKSWIGKDSNSIAGMALDIGKTAKPLTLWGMELGWTLPELASAQQLGRPVDTQKFAGMNMKYQMDIDEQVYIGDTTIGVTGLTNSAAVSTTNAVNGAAGFATWATKTADEILTDIDAILEGAWEASGYARVPTKLLLPPKQWGSLTTRKVASAGNISILNYVIENCISTANNGVPLDIKPVKWLKGRGVGGTNRMVTYTQDPTLVRFPLVPLQRTPLEYRGIFQLCTYYGRLGALEIVYPETLAYVDGI